MARTVVCALVNSRLDYANSVLFGTSSANVANLQRIQNALAQVVKYTKRTEHMHPVLEQLHWLSVERRVEFKVVILAIRCGQPEAKSILNLWSPTNLPPRQLRSSGQLLLNKSQTRTMIARYAFSQAAPVLSGMNCHSTFGPPTHSGVSETFFEHTTTDSLSNIDHVTVRLARFNVHTLTYGASSKTFNNNN